MAASQIEEKILGRLARQTESSNALLSASLYQVLGLSILLSRKLFRARKLRKLDITRDTKSLQLYHQIVWLAREGLAITEVYILPCCKDGAQGAECQVMAAKLQASLYHVFCLFHNSPPINQTRHSGSSSSSNTSPRGSNGQSRRSSSRSPKGGNGHRRNKSGKAVLRDPIPSMTSEASYITNPYASPPSPPPSGPPPPLPPEARKTPTHPPGLTPIKISSPQAAASYLLPPLNFVPMTREHFAMTQQMAQDKLPPAHALRLSVSLEHAAFLWDCVKEHEEARDLARNTIKAVYASTEGLDDEEFADAAALVQALGGIVKRGSSESTPKIGGNKVSPPVRRQLPVPPKKQSRPESQRSPPPRPPRTGVPPIDRTIAVSPPSTKRSRASPPSRTVTASPPQIMRSVTRSHDRLSTVPEDPSQEASERETTAPTTVSPPISRLSSRSNPSKGRRPSATSTSGISDKAAKRKAVEAAEELYRRNSVKSAAGSSRQTTPVEGYVRRPPSPPPSNPRRRQ